LDCLRQIANAMPMLMGKTSQMGVVRSPSIPPAITIDEEPEEQQSAPPPLDTIVTTAISSGTNVAASTPAPPVTITRPECFGEPTGLVKRRIRTITTTGVDDVMPASPLAKERYFMVTDCFI
uniref:Polyprotein n=1 Tax=Toxocara canis TaxID=6265 RepID=A0A183U5S1_TOXCA